MPHQHSSSSASTASSSSLRDFTTSRFGSLSGLSLWAASGNGNGHEGQASQEQQSSQENRSLASPLDLKSPRLDGDEADQLDWADETITGREGVPNKSSSDGSLAGSQTPESVRSSLPPSSSSQDSALSTNVSTRPSTDHDSIAESSSRRTKSKAGNTRQQLRRIDRGESAETIHPTDYSSPVASSSRLSPLARSDSGSSLSRARRHKTSPTDSLDSSRSSSHDTTLKAPPSSRSLRSIASSWIPGSSTPISTAEGNALVRRPNDSDQQVAIVSPRPNGPVRLDRRRLDKAVSLAVEAAQAAEQDELLRRKQKERARRRREKARLAALQQQQRSQDDSVLLLGSSLMSRIRTIGGEFPAGQGRTRLSRLPWRAKEVLVGSSSTPQGSPRTGAKTMPSSLVNSDRSATTSEDEDSSVRPASDEEDSDEDQGKSGEEEAMAEAADNFSLSLYLSSLSYLLSALPTQEAAHLPEKERQELRAKLQEVLIDIGCGKEEAGTTAASTSTLNTEAEREARLREMLEQELRRAEARMLGGRPAATTSPKLQTGNGFAKDSQRRRSTEPDSQSSSFAGTVAFSALQLTFAVAAAGVGLVGTGISKLAPATTPGDHGSVNTSDSPIDGSAKIVGEVPEDEKRLVKTAAPEPAPRSTGRSSAPTTRRTGTNGLQWDLAMALASSTASTLYGCLSSAAAEAAAREKAGSEERAQLQRLSVEADVHQVLERSREEGETSPEDSLILLSSSFAKALRRSPLPSQVSTLSSQLLTLLHQVDEKYELRKRATDEALKRTRQGLGYVRKKGWHVLAIRGAWTLMEMGVAGMEGWREEGEAAEGTMSDGRQSEGAEPIGGTARSGKM